MVIGLVDSLLILPSLCQLRWPGIEVLSHLTCTAVTLVTPGRAPWVLRSHATMCSRFRPIHLQAHARAYVHTAHGLACERARRHLVTRRTRVHSGWTSAPTALRQVAVHCWRMGSWSTRVGVCACNLCVLHLSEIDCFMLFCRGGCVGDSQKRKAKSRVRPSHRSGGHPCLCVYCCVLFESKMHGLLIRVSRW